MSNIFIISGPSGAGEDSVIEGLKKILPIEKIVTSTTRKIRPGEVHGVNYYFISKGEFEEKIKNDALAEWAQEYNNNFYGVTKEELARVENSRKIGLWKIEYKGVMTAKTKFPEIKSIYIAPPSLEVLRRRIMRRDPSVSDQYLDERMEYTKEWMQHENIYDYKVVNEEGKLEETIQKVAEIIKNVNA
ncbi:MAG: guanylate kinase [Candidatus Moranbacteria bacterium]|nr:guanylate kinase [Candidatus Moranbacteria bacterium]